MLAKRESAKMRYSISTAVVLLVGIFASCQASSVLFVDNSGGAYLKRGNEVVNVDSQSFPSLVSSLLGLVPPEGDVNLEASNAFIYPSLKKSRAHVALNVGGLSSGTMGQS